MIQANHCTKRLWSAELLKILYSARAHCFCDECNEERSSDGWADLSRKVAVRAERVTVFPRFKSARATETLFWLELEDLRPFEVKEPTPLVWTVHPDCSWRCRMVLKSVTWKQCIMPTVLLAAPEPIAEWVPKRIRCTT